MKLHPESNKPLMYLSGSGSGIDEKQLIKLGCRFRCYSYCYVCPGAFNYQARMHRNLKASIKHGVGVMMDSSAHSFHIMIRKGHRQQVGKWRSKDVDALRDKLINHYTEYAKREGKLWDWYVNFDYIHDAQIVYDMQKVLEKKGIRPVPVYHAGEDLEWLARYGKEGYKLVGIGLVGKTKSFATRSKMYDGVFNTAAKYGMKLHGFAVTGLSLMYRFPWHSVDSATWVKVAAYGSVIHPDLNRGVIGEIHVTDQRVNGKTDYHSLPRHHQKEFERQVEDAGFDIKELQTDGTARCLYNAYVFCQVAPKLQSAVKESRIQWKNL